MESRDYIRAQLRAKLAEVNEEIRTYPQPIARCDAQLAGLHEERAKLLEALDWLVSAVERETVS
jgi:sugar-specific transcriptional regulator TrmB